MTLPPIAPPKGLKDFQENWFWRLFFALTKAGGYLPFGSDLWKLTGALTRARWDANSAAVLAAFEFSEPDAEGRRNIFYPPMIAIIAEQKKKYGRRSQDKREFSESSTAIHKGGDYVSLSASQSALEFEVQNQEPSPKTNSRPHYTQSDFDARDLRRLKEAGDKFDRMTEASVGSNPQWMSDQKKVYEWLCREAGITVERGLELDRVQTKWPQEGTSAFAAAGD